MKRYSNIRQIKNTNENVASLGVNYYRPNFYPEIPEDETDIYVITEFGDRLELLADQFYDDITLYWIIAAANPDVVDFGSLTIPEGSQIRIPLNIAEIVSSYNRLNSL